MYHEFFGFYTAPFSLSPHLHFVYSSDTFEETMAHLIYGLDGGEDLILITRSEELFGGARWRAILRRNF